MIDTIINFALSLQHYCIREVKFIINTHHIFAHLSRVCPVFFSVSSNIKSNGARFFEKKLVLGFWSKRAKREVFSDIIKNQC